VADAPADTPARPADMPARPAGIARPGAPADRRVFVLDSEAWKTLSGLLELPVRDVAGLRALLANATVLS
jgi:hypothetical protein